GPHLQPVVDRKRDAVAAAPADVVRSRETYARAARRARRTRALRRPRRAVFGAGARALRRQPAEGPLRAHTALRAQGLDRRRADSRRGRRREARDLRHPRRARRRGARRDRDLVGARGDPRPLTSRARDAPRPHRRRARGRGDDGGRNPRGGVRRRACREGAVTVQAEAAAPGWRRRITYSRLRGAGILIPFLILFIVLSLTSS